MYNVLQFYYTSLQHLIISNLQLTAILLYKITTFNHKQCTTYCNFAEYHVCPLFLLHYNVLAIASVLKMTNWSNTNIFQPERVDNMVDCVMDPVYQFR